jgi:hypothetical protein
VLPTQDTNHINEALAKLLEQFKRAPVLNGLLKSYAWSIQDLENAVWSVINSRYLANAANAQLDLLGKLVGEGRNGRSDADYRAVIGLRIRANRSQGGAEDLIQLCALALGVAQGSGAVFYQDGAPMHWQIDISDTTSGVVLALVELLPIAKMEGTEGSLTYSLWPDALSWILDSSTVVGAPNANAGLDDSVSDSLGFLLSSSAGI